MSIKDRRAELDKKIAKEKARHEREMMLIKHEAELIRIDCDHPRKRMVAGCMGREPGYMWCPDCKTENVR